MLLIFFLILDFANNANSYRKKSYYDSSGMANSSQYKNSWRIGEKTSGCR
jgi:hypothetical protein